MSHYSSSGNTLTLYCHIQPNASADRLSGLHNGRIKIQLAASPTEGKANRHLLKVLSRLLKVAKSRISISHGLSSRHKTIEIKGLDDQTSILEKLSSLL